MPDVFEAHRLEPLHRLAAAETSCAIDEDGEGPVEGARLLVKSGIAERNVDRPGQRAAGVFAFRAHVEHLGPGMFAQKGRRFDRIEIFTDFPGLGGKEPTIPTPLENIPAHDDDEDRQGDKDQRRPIHAPVTGSGSGCDFALTMK